MGHKRKDWVVVESLIDMVLSNVEGCVVEIGIGVSTTILLEHAKKLGIKLISCDINKKKCDWAKKLGVSEVYEGKSLDFIQQFPDVFVALALIDGDHRYPTVIEEVNFFLSKLSPGGVLFMHDTLKPSWDAVYGKVTSDSYLVRQEMEKRDGLMTFTWPYTAFSYGLTMLMLKEKNVPKFRR